MDLISDYGLACCHTANAISKINDVEGALARESAAYRRILNHVWGG